MGESFSCACIQDMMDGNHDVNTDMKASTISTKNLKEEDLDKAKAAVEPEPEPEEEAKSPGRSRRFRGKQAFGVKEEDKINKQRAI